LSLSRNDKALSESKRGLNAREQREGKKLSLFGKLSGDEDKEYKGV